MKIGLCEDRAVHRTEVLRRGKSRASSFRIAESLKTLAR